MIPLYIIEEHHEAFYIWNQATEKGYLPPFGNALLHVDHHPDFECGAYGVDLSFLFDSLTELRTFTYGYLGIADFICPAIYQGIFNEIVIVRDFTPLLSVPEEKMITFDTNMSLNVQDLTPFCRNSLINPEADYRLFTYRQGGLGDFSSPQAIALDIDLDYFCWDDSLSSVIDKRIEITEQAYYDITENPYHPFRILPKKWLHPVADKGRYFLCYLGLPKPDSIPDKTRIQKRIDLFVNWIDRNDIEVCMISLCRSRYSGYTPRIIWEEIEKNLLKRLAEVYDYDLQS